MSITRSKALTTTFATRVPNRIRNESPTASGPCPSQRRRARKRLASGGGWAASAITSPRSTKSGPSRTKPTDSPAPADVLSDGGKVAIDATRAVRAKTGSLDAVAALSGYVLPPAGRSPVAFSVLVNGIPGKVNAARGLMDHVVDALAREVWKGAAGSPP